MAYVLMVVGLLMAGSGLATVTYSSLNARFDDYWTSLAVGATLIAGGVVTIALGVVVRTLQEMRTAWMVQPIARAPVDAAKVADASMADATMHVPDARIPDARIPDARIPDTKVPDTKLPELAPAVARRDREPRIETLPRVEQIPPVPAPDVKPHPLRPPRVAPPPLPTPPVAAPYVEAPASLHQPEPVTVPHQDAPRQEELAVNAAHSADAYQLETPSTAEHDLPKAEPAGPAAPYSDDWLERAFAELDEELPMNRPSSKPADTRVEEEPAKEELAKPEVAELEPAMAAVPEPVHPVAEASQPRQSPQPAQAATSAISQSAVIGRYEADGTSYVMFADGSIEAQSSAGVYRFKSMAELKAFIET